MLEPRSSRRRDHDARGQVVLAAGDHNLAGRRRDDGLERPRQWRGAENLEEERLQVDCVALGPQFSDVLLVKVAQAGQVELGRIA
jgi:hypothetical protein